MIHKTLEILGAQLEKSKQDLDKLYQLQKNALTDPLRFVENLKAKVKPKGCLNSRV
jgi:hypothetical protein